MKKYLHRPFHKPDYEIISDCPELIESLCLQYGNYISDAECENPYRINITKDTENPLLRLDNILFDTTIYDESVIPLHGAAVEYGGRTYVFLAPTTSGKTTLISYLIHNGMGYITEDCVLLDKQTFGVYPYPCPVHLRDGGVEVLNRYGITISDMKELDTHAGTRYVYTPRNYVRSITPLGGIFFMARSETENSETDMTVSESIMELMKSSITVYQPSAEHIKLLSKLVQIGCKHLIYKDMEYVRDIIMRGN